MAQAAKLRPEEAGGSSFAVPSGMSKLADYPRRLRQFLHDVRVEMKQVNWPTRTDVWSTTMVVVVTVTFFGVFFFVVDRFVSYLVQELLKIFKS